MTTKKLIESLHQSNQMISLFTLYIQTMFACCKNILRPIITLSTYAVFGPIQDLWV